MFRYTAFGLATSDESGRSPQYWRWIPVIVSAGIILLCAGGCGDSAQIKTLNPDSLVLAFGDSLTSGKGASDSDGYPAVLSQLTGHTVINAGVSGEGSASGLQRLPSVLKKHQPDLVILCHGGNDMLRKQHRDATVANLDAMITMIKQTGADVILVGVPEPGIFVNTASFYSDLAQTHGIPYEGEIVAKVLADASLKSDYVHPNARGYRTLAESVATLIRECQST
jgi:lysophospholipase L1-like esterase